MGWHEHYELGKRAFEDGDYPTARKHLETVLKEKDDFADVYNMLGIIYASENRHKDSINALERALAINPRYTDAALNLSIVYNETGDYDKAQELYVQAKASVGKKDEKDKNTYLDSYIKSKLANMHAQLGAIYKDLGMHEDAIDEYTRALYLRPDFEDIRTNLGAVYREAKDYGKSVKMLEEAANMKPDYTPAKIQLGLTYFTMGQFERAKAEWLKVLEKKPNDKLVNMYLNLLKGRTG